MSNQLTAEQEALVNTDFGEEIEKVAAAKVATINSSYEYGFSKLAAEHADAQDEEEKKEKEEKEKGKDKEEKMDEESEKAAAEIGAFIERGYFDGLRKLGQERHNNEMHYIEPLLLQKAAAAGAGQMSKALAALKSGGNKAVQGAKSYHAGMAADAMSAVKGVPVAHRAGGQFMTNPALAPLTGKERVMAGGKALAKASPYLVLGGGAAMAASSKKKD